MRRLPLFLIFCLISALACNVSRIDESDQATATPQASLPITTDSGAAITYALIFPDDKGQNGSAVGCDDSIVMINSGASATGDLSADLRAALGALFTDNAPADARHINALAGAGITVSNITVTGDATTIELGGNLQPSGVCGDARLAGQIVRTVFQFPSLNSALITVNGGNIKMLFDAQGTVQATDPYLRSELP